MAIGPYQWSRYTNVSTGFSGSAITSAALTVAVGDAVVFQIRGPTTVTPPSGFTQVSNPKTGFHIYYCKYATSTSPTFTFASSDARWYYFRFKPPGHITADADVGVTVGSVSSEATAAVAPTITPGGGPATVVCVWACDGSNGTGMDSWPSTTFDHLRWSSNATAPSASEMAVCQTYQATPSATGTNTMDGSGGQDGWAFHIAFYDATGDNLLTPMTAGSATSQGGNLTQYDYTTSWADGTDITAPNQVNPLIDEAITALAASGDTGVGLNAGADAISYSRMALTNVVDADFDSMETLAIRYSSVAFSTYSDDLGFLGCVVLSVGGGVLAGYSSTFGRTLDMYHSSNGWETTGGPGTTILGRSYSRGSGGTPPAYDRSVAFDYVDTSATQSDWNGAVIEFAFVDSKTKGSDSAAIILVDFELVGTYTPVVVGSLPPMSPSRYSKKMVIR